MTSESEQPVPPELREKLLEPFILAVNQALHEMTRADVIVRSVDRKTLASAPGDVSAVIELRSAKGGFLVLTFSRQAASALAGRMLADVAQALDEDLIRDCVGEITNVVAGQAEALLAETPYRFTFSVPHFVTGAIPRSKDMDCLVIIFNSEHGEFALQLFLPRPASRQRQLPDSPP